MKQYIQFGAGLCGPDGWINYDISPTLRLQRLPIVGSLFNSVGPRFPPGVRYGDIIRGLPLEDNSCDAIYCSHVLEHLSLNDFRLALKNTYKYLKQSGRFRFVLPDLQQLAQDYLQSSQCDAAMSFMKDSYLGHLSRPKGFSGLLRAWLGNSAHLWMWDYKSIESELKNIGFTGIRRAQFGDSGDSRFDLVEDRGRWDRCLGVECTKPGT
jgi:SAM-dependent methyltransferase